MGTHRPISIGIGRPLPRRSEDPPSSSPARANCSSATAASSPSAATDATPHASWAARRGRAAAAAARGQRDDANAAAALGPVDICVCAYCALWGNAARVSQWGRRRAYSISRSLLFRSTRDFLSWVADDPNHRCPAGARSIETPDRSKRPP